MPLLNEIKLGNKLGYRNTHQYIWTACSICGWERWMQRNSSGGRCHKCAGKEYTEKYSRENAACWKGGRVYLRDKGYICIKLPFDDFFHSMVDQHGYVLEHRLVMAKSLGRCLHRWELVHHKNGIRDDNRIENLQLVSDDRHKQITILENRIKHLENRVTMLEAENVLLKQASFLPS